MSGLREFRAQRARGWAERMNRQVTRANQLPSPPVEGSLTRMVGLALEASHAVVRHAYDAWNWPTVETYTRDGNAAAIALVSRLGGVQVDRRAFPDGEDRNVFRIPRPV
jgi:hypothetical protein